MSVREGKTGTLGRFEQLLSVRPPGPIWEPRAVILSPGDLVALGLAAKSWSVEQCAHHFEDLCRRAFTRRAGRNISAIGWFLDKQNHLKYKVRPRQDAFASAYSKHEPLLGGPRPHASYGSDVRVAVKSTSESGSAIVSAKRPSLWRKALTLIKPVQHHVPASLQPAVRLLESLVRLPTVRSHFCGKLSDKGMRQPKLAIRTQQRQSSVCLRSAHVIYGKLFEVPHPQTGGARQAYLSTFCRLSLLYLVMVSPPSSCKRRHMGREPAVDPNCHPKQGQRSGQADS